MEPDGVPATLDGIVQQQYVHLYDWLRREWPLAVQRREAAAWLNARQWERVRRQAN